MAVSDAAAVPGSAPRQLTLAPAATRAIKLRMRISGEASSATNEKPTLLCWCFHRDHSKAELFLPVFGETLYRVQTAAADGVVEFGRDVESACIEHGRSFGRVLSFHRRFDRFLEVRSPDGAIAICPLRFGVSRSEDLAFKRQLRAMYHLNMYPVTDAWAFADTAPVFALDAAAASAPTLKICAVVHVHYPELWDELANYLACIPGAPDLVVTVTEPAGSVAGAIRSRFLDADIVPVANRGFDIAPFLSLLRAGRLDGYDLICKVHTKKSVDPAGRETLMGRVWRRYSLHPLLGGRARVSGLVGRFETEAKLGLVGPARFRMNEAIVRRGRPLGKNGQATAPLAAAMGAGAADLALDFFAGTMFWVRRQALEPLRRLELGPHDFPEGGHYRDGTTAHAIERLFCLSTAMAGFAVEGV